ncbi:huntingtin-interacting protein 1-like [Cynoglossus semilaevis]|uniref:huntingtin-interacting protein 1-like n=1 Tax=Cynoglossus semilaevis TaxID=244447 RepID=UPI0007DCB046|nr:huntingtin-interacting protein 1-like [Cynoglossus semilaevis]
MRNDDKDRLIEQLTKEIQSLKEELDSFRLESGRLCQVLRGRVNELEAELAEQSHLRLQAMGESEFLKAELDDLRRVREDTEKEQRSLTEIESKSFFIVFQRLSTDYKSLRNTGRSIQSNTSALWWP